MFLKFIWQWASSEAPQTVPGLEYTLDDNRLRYTQPENLAHYTQPKNKLHFTLPEED